jgi:hypothetical protein
MKSPFRSACGGGNQYEPMIDPRIAKELGRFSKKDVLQGLQQKRKPR